jgi:hypothetical protein
LIVRRIRFWQGPQSFPHGGTIVIVELLAKSLKINGRGERI